EVPAAIPSYTKTVLQFPRNFETWSHDASFQKRCVRSNVLTGETKEVAYEGEVPESDIRQGPDRCNNPIAGSHAWCSVSDDAGRTDRPAHRTGRYGTGILGRVHPGRRDG